MGTDVLGEPQAVASVVNRQAQAKYLRNLSQRETRATDFPALVASQIEKSAEHVSGAFYPPNFGGPSAAQRSLTLGIAGTGPCSPWWAREPLPLAEIRAALFENRAPPPISLQSQPLASGSFLHQLDQVPGAGRTDGG